MSIWTFQCNKCNKNYEWEDDEMLNDEKIINCDVIDEFECLYCGHKNELVGSWDINVRDKR